MARQIFNRVKGLREVYLHLCSQIGTPTHDPPLASVKLLLKPGASLKNLRDGAQPVLAEELEHITDLPRCSQAMPFIANALNKSALVILVTESRGSAGLSLPGKGDAMKSNTHGFLNSLAKRWFALNDAQTNKEDIRNGQAITRDEILRAIQYLDPEPEDLGVTEDEEIFLAIQYLDPDFN